MSRVEKPSYTVVESLGDFELRDYPPLIVAEVEVSGERKQAINAGFRMFANYIFGNNAPREKIAMTAPVTQHRHDHSAFGPVSSANLSKHIRNHNFIEIGPMGANSRLSYTVATNYFLEKASG